MIKRNIVFGLAGQLALTLLALITTHFVFKKLGGEILGIIGFAVTLTSLLIFLADMGISIAITREIAAKRSTDMPYVRNLVSSASMIGWIAFVLSILIVIWIAPKLVEKWLQFKDLDSNNAVFFLEMISIALLFAVPRTIYGAVIAGYNRMDFWNTANFLSMGLQQVGLILILALGGGLSQIAVWYLISGFFSLFLFILLAGKLAGAKALYPAFRTSIIKNNFNFSAFLFANSITGYINTQADRWIISKLLPLETLGYYNFVQGLITKGSIVPNTIASSTFPSLSENIESELVWKKQYYKLQDLCAYVCVPIFAAVAILGIIVVRITFNDQVAELVGVPLIILSLSQFLLSTLYIPNWITVALKKPEILLRTSIWALVLVLPFTILLINKFGLIGAAISALLYSTWQLIYFVPRFCKECLSISMRDWYSQAVIFITLGITSYGLCWFGISIFGYGLTSKGAISAYALGTIIFLPLGWLALCEDLKSSFRHSLNKLLTRYKSS